MPCLETRQGMVLDTTTSALHLAMSWGSSCRQECTYPRTRVSLGPDLGLIAVINIQLDMGWSLTWRWTVWREDEAKLSTKLGLPSILDLRQGLVSCLEIG